jgi:hypothetical protein
MRFAFDLWNHADVVTRADSILARLRSGSMPCDGAWSEEWISAFARWTASGNDPRTADDVEFDGAKLSDLLNGMGPRSEAGMRAAFQGARSHRDRKDDRPIRPPEQSSANEDERTQPCEIQAYRPRALELANRARFESFGR